MDLLPKGIGMRVPVREKAEPLPLKPPKPLPATEGKLSPFSTGDTLDHNKFTDHLSNWFLIIVFLLHFHAI